MEEHNQEGPAIHHGGDDLEDDFVDEEEQKPAKSKKAKQSGPKPATGTGNEEKSASAKQAPKVVKFFG